MMVVSTVMAGLARDFGFTTVNTVLYIPIGLQEMVLAIWLIVKGFSQSALSTTASWSAPPSAPSYPPSEALETRPVVRST